MALTGLLTRSGHLTQVPECLRVACSWMARRWQAEAMQQQQQQQQQLSLMHHTALAASTLALGSAYVPEAMVCK